MPEIVQEIGAYAGLASVVGLAVLSALYFSQARDVKRLREWAGRAPERAEGQAPAVPGRVAAQPAGGPGQPPVPGAPPVPAAPPVPGAPRVPGAPPTAAPRPAATPAAAAAAGARPATATPARSGAATPSPRPAQPVPAASGGSSGSPAAVPMPAAAGTAAPANPAEAGQRAGAQSADEKAAPTDAPQPSSAASNSPPPDAAAAETGTTKDGAANAGAADSGPAKDGATKAAVATGSAPSAPPPRPAPSPPVPSAARTAPPSARTAPPSATSAAAGRPGGPSRLTQQATTVLPPSRRPPWYRSLLSNPLYAVLAVAGVLIVGGAAAFGIVQLASDDGSDSSAGQSAGAGSGGDAQGNGGGGDAGSGDKPRPDVRPGSVTVAVLNGTTVPGLAATLADQVTSAGFNAGTVANFTSNPPQELAESVVQYASGHEQEAAAVGRRLGIGQREAATAQSQELAGDATVIVIVGGDKAP